MDKKRHVPPSRLRYEQQHPTVSVRVSRELYERLQALKRDGGKSLGDILREAVGVQARSARAAYSRGYNTGYAEAEKRYRVDFPCHKCDGLMSIEHPGTKQAAAQYMHEHRWTHAACQSALAPHRNPVSERTEFPSSVVGSLPGLSESLSPTRGRAGGHRPPHP